MLESKNLWIKVLRRYFLEVHGQTIEDEDKLLHSLNGKTLVDVFGGESQKENVKTLAQHIEEVTLENIIKNKNYFKTFIDWHRKIQNKSNLPNNSDGVKQLRKYAEIQNRLSGTWVCYQWDLIKHDIQENYSKTFWYIATQTETTAQTIGKGLQERAYSGDVKEIDGNISLNAQQTHGALSNLNYALEYVEKDILQGFATFFRPNELQARKLPACRAVVFTRLENSRTQWDTHVPKLLLWGELPNDIQQLFTLLSPPHSESVTQTVPQNQLIAIQTELNSSNDENGNLKTELNEKTKDLKKLEDENKILKAKTEHLGKLEGENKDLKAKTEHLGKLEIENKVLHGNLTAGRRQFNAGILILCLLLLVSGDWGYQSWQLQKTYHWNLSMAWDMRTIHRSVISEFIHEVQEGAKKKGYDFNIHVLPNGLLPHQKWETNKENRLDTLFGAVKSNQIQMAYGVAYYWHRRVPAALFFCSIPNGMELRDMEKWLETKEGVTLWDSLYDQEHLVHFPLGNTDKQLAGWFKKPILNIQSFTKLKMRMGNPIARDVLKAVDAIPDTTAITPHLIPQRLADSLDAAEWISLIDDDNLGLPAVRGIKYAYNSYWHEPNTLNELVINQDAFKNLPKSLQVVIKEAAKHTTTHRAGIYTSADEKVIENKIKNKYGIKLEPFPQAIEDSLRRLSSKKVYEFVHEKHHNAFLIHEIYESYYSNYKDPAGINPCKENCKWRKK